MKSKNMKYKNMKGMWLGLGVPGINWREMAGMDMINTLHACMNSQR